MKMTFVLTTAFCVTALCQSPAQAADLTKVERMSCVVIKSARCKKEGGCKWKPASERDKAQVLVIDFKAKSASFQRGDRRKQIGLVAEDKLAGGVRRIVLSATGKRDPRREMVMLIQQDGSFKGWRAQKRVRFEGTCKLS